MSNRKLIRPNLRQIKERMTNKNSKRKSSPPEQTNAESFYYLKQMSSKTLMVIVLTDGEIIRGIIEWYDRHCIKINREGAPNLLIPKLNIKYTYKAEDTGDDH
jgi:sRNA-binding regulator protein Hfq